MSRSVSTLLASPLTWDPQYRDKQDPFDPWTADLQKIRDEVSPEGWTTANWEYHKRQAVAQRVYALWTLYTCVQWIGWVEHTNDWDWWVQLTTVGGEEIRWECGSEIQAMGWPYAMWWHPQAGERNWQHGVDDELPTHIRLDGFLDVGDDTDHEKAIQENYAIADLAKIELGYDT